MITADIIETRPGLRADATRIAQIYNEGIEDRIATYETRLRSVEDVEAWFDADYPLVVAERGGVIGAYALATPYRARPCYAGVREFSIYVAREMRGHG
ncbi:hypothetical protein GCM10007276_09230 [Agaricicola taiwanensis]|uniref:GNAT family N-acetyltransferase n=1 Tax=Agaricicola taiwanensis TaxID=591372 RepID=A0A8J2VN55_9RHOB|nr:hypothetical protein [Agaricicola taiwanensis]GGE34027.1 hypothetical protein GCM10007276_09230 [Agaricicola taiwanensis]